MAALATNTKALQQPVLHITMDTSHSQTLILGSLPSFRSYNNWHGDPFIVKSLVSWVTHYPVNGVIPKEVSGASALLFLVKTENNFRHTQVFVQAKMINVLHYLSLFLIDLPPFLFREPAVTIVRLATGPVSL